MPGSMHHWQQDIRTRQCQRQQHAVTVMPLPQIAEIWRPAPVQHTSAGAAGQVV